MLFSSIKSYIQKIYSVSLVREALQVSLPLFWTRPSTKNFYKNTQNCSFSVASPEHTNYNLLGRQLLIGHTIEETLMARDTVIFLLQQLGFVLNLKKSVLTPTQRIEFFGGDSTFINHDPVSTREESLKGSEAVSRTSSEYASVDFRINKTNSLIVFN